MVPTEARRKDIRNSRTGVTEVYEPPHEYWEPNPGPMERASYAINHWTIYPYPCYFLSKLLKFFFCYPCAYSHEGKTLIHLNKIILNVLKACFSDTSLFRKYS